MRTNAAVPTRENGAEGGVSRSEGGGSLRAGCSSEVQDTGDGASISLGDNKEMQV
jgi:hypothetical protein